MRSRLLRPAPPRGTTASSVDLPAEAEADELLAYIVDGTDNGAKIDKRINRLPTTRPLFSGGKI